MGRKGYPAEFRRRALDLVAAGKSVAEVAAAWVEAFDESVSPAEAETDFGSAVGAAYRTYVLAEPDRLWVLGRVGDQGFPDCTGFLALSVLATYEMHADEDAGPNAFYLRLA